MADKVMKIADSASVGSPPFAIQRRCGTGADSETKALQTKYAASANSDTALDVAAAWRATKGSGAPLSKELRSHFEPRFGHDFSQVRVHADGEAADGARAVQARAYTIGRDIVFGEGEYAPTTVEGRRLLAHELTHFIQQQGQEARDTTATQTPRPSSSPVGWDSPIKRVASEHSLATMLRGVTRTPSQGVQRKPSNEPFTIDEKIRKELETKPTDAAGAERRYQRLRELFESVPKERAERLYNILSLEDKGNDFAKFFHVRVVDPGVRRELLESLRRKYSPISPQAPVVYPGMARAGEQTSRVRILRAMNRDLLTSFAGIDAALPKTTAYESVQTIRDNVMQDVKSAIDDAERALQSSPYLLSSYIQNRTEQAELWIYLVPAYAALAALLRSAETDRLITSVISEISAEESAYEKGFTAIERGTPPDLAFVRGTAPAQIAHTKNLVSNLHKAIQSGQRFVSTAESVESVLDIPLAFAKGVQLGPMVLLINLVVDVTGFYRAHQNDLDTILSKGQLFVSELAWFEANAPHTRKKALHPIYEAIVWEAVKSFTAADVAFIMGRTLRMSKAAKVVTWKVVTASLAKAVGLVTLLDSPVLLLHGTGTLTKRTGENVNEFVAAVNKALGTDLSASEVAGLVLELKSQRVVDHIKRLSGVSQELLPPITAVMTDVLGTGGTTATAASAAAGMLAYPMLPLAP